MIAACYANLTATVLLGLLALWSLFRSARDWRLSLWVSGFVVAGGFDLAMYFLRSRSNLWIDHLLTPVLCLTLLFSAASWLQGPISRAASQVASIAVAILWGVALAMGWETFSQFGAITKPLYCLASFAIGMGLLAERSLLVKRLTSDHKAWFGLGLALLGAIDIAPRVFFHALAPAQEITLWVGRNIAFTCTSLVLARGFTTLISTRPR